MIVSLLNERLEIWENVFVDAWVGGWTVKGTHEGYKGEGKTSFGYFPKSLEEWNSLLGILPS